MTTYQYSPLDIGASEIRLLKLLPGPFDPKIRIDIDNVVLTKDHVPQFEALSYAWGSAESRGNMFIGTKMRTSNRLLQRAAVTSRAKAMRSTNSPVRSIIDKKKRRTSNRLAQTATVKLGATLVSRRTLAVTQNLATALRYLRYSDRQRVLWVDAICVDQGNLEERSQQVARMADIYALANRVLVWLGPESRDSALALKSLRDVGSEVTVDWDLRTYRTTSGGKSSESESTNDLLTSQFDESIWTSIFSLLIRPWFGRLWIWQEVRLAKNGVQVFCGSGELPWEIFGNAIFYLEGMSLPMIPQDPLGLWKCMRRAFELSSLKRLSNLYMALDTTRDSECSDNKDKIYAILNLVDKRERMGLEPDYSRSTFEVYQDVVFYSLINRKSLQLLRFCERREPAADKPTWVPDWSSPNDCNLLQHFEASLSSEAHAEYVGKGILRVTGVCAAKIDRTENCLPPENPSDHQLAETVKRIAVSVLKSKEYVGGGTMFDAVCRTLCCNMFSDNYEPNYSYFPDYSQSKDVVRGFLSIYNNREPPSDKDQTRYLDEVAKAFRGRSFFVTDDGYIGLAPRTVEPGDQVCILLGCRAPLVLRLDATGRHSVIGECYIHGLMDGAAFVGSLPDTWQSVLRYDSVSRDCFLAIKNLETGRTQIEDPRLGPLPAGWRIGTHEKESDYNMYVNDETGRRTNRDPRASPEALRARGVKLQDFWLK